MKIELVKGEKALSVNGKFDKGIQPFTKTVKIYFSSLTSRGPARPSSTCFCCTWNPEMLCTRVAICLGEPYTTWSATLML